MPIDDESKLVPLHDRNGVMGYCKVSASDYDTLVQWRWSLSASGYARHSVERKGRVSNLLMHHVVLERMGFPRVAGLLADHIDRDKLNNVRENLRWVDWPTSLRNRKVIGACKFRGVYAGRYPWSGAIYVPEEGKGTKRIYLGRFDTAEMTALAYDLYAVEHSVPVELNFPEVWGRTWGNDGGPMPDVMPVLVRHERITGKGRKSGGRTGHRSMKGQEHPRAKLRNEDVVFILEHREMSGIELAERFSLHPVTICRIRRGDRWPHLYNQFVTQSAVNEDKEPPQ